MRRILLIKPGAMGDLLQLTPCIRALREKWPETQITVVVGTDESASLFRHNPAVAETIIYEYWGRHKSLSGFRHFLRDLLRREPFDLVVNYQRSNLRTWLMAAAARPHRLRVYHKTRKPVIHAVFDHIRPVMPLGIVPPLQPLLELTSGPEDGRFAGEVWEREGLAGSNVVGFNPGASNLIKCWDVKRFAALGNRLAHEAGVRLVLVGGGSERGLADGIRASLLTPAVDLVGATTMLQLGAVLARCDVLVSGDTGPLHMATAVATPVVGLFGAIDPQRTGPVGEGHLVIRHPEIPCVPCMDKKCRNPVYLECMEAITVDEVFAAVVRLLNRRKPQ